MSSSSLLQQSISNVVLLAFLSVFSRILVDTHVKRSSGLRLMDAAIGWSNKETTSLVGELEHLVTSLTFLHSAKMVTTDEGLEKSMWVDLSRLERKVRRRLKDVRSKLESVFERA